jgi:hypothetical protein
MIWIVTRRSARVLRADGSYRTRSNRSGTATFEVSSRAAIDTDHKMV